MEVINLMHVSAFTFMKYLLQYIYNLKGACLNENTSKKHCVYVEY